MGRSGFVGGVPFITGLLLGLTPSPASANDEIIGAKNSKVFHSRECNSARKILEENRIHFVSAKEAELAGRRLCRNCARAAEKDEQKSAEPPEKNGDVKPKPLGPKRDAAPLRAGDVASLPELVRVVEVLPGGTVELDNGEKARLLGVACPDKGQPNEKHAVRFLDEQTRGRLVRLTYDAHPGPGGHRDALGRLRVYMAAEPDGRDLGGELIFQGYAWLDRAAWSERRREYARREEEAWRAGRGIWKQLEGEAGRREVITGRHAHHYHLPKCLHGVHLTQKATMTLNEARSRRLTPCTRYRIRRKNG